MYCSVRDDRLFLCILHSLYILCGKLCSKYHASYIPFVYCSCHPAVNVTTSDEEEAFLGGPAAGVLRIHTYIHTYMHACMHTYIHTYIHTTCIRIYTYTCVHTYECTLKYIYIYIHTYTHISTYMYMPHLHIYTSTYVYIYAYIHIHMYTCT